MQGPIDPNILADQLTIFEPGGGADYGHQVTTCPPDFQTFLRPCDLFVIHSAVR